jgi:hypothetical protein
MAFGYSTPMHKPTHFIGGVPIAILALSMAVIALSEALAQNAPAPATPPAPATLPARQFNSKLTLEVWVSPKISDRSNDKLLGKTPANAPLEIPACEGWNVVPQAPISFPALVDEINAQHIPGLSLPQETTDADLAKLATLKDLQILDLDVTKVTDAGLAELKKLTNLRTLNLEKTEGITDAAVDHLKELKTLERLNLRGTGVSDAGVTKLQAALPACKIER